MTRSLADVSKSELAKKLDSARGTLKRTKEKFNSPARKGANAAIVTASGYATGLARAKMGDMVIPGTEIPVDAAVGVGLVGLSIAGLGDQYSDTIGAAGAGVLAASAALYAAGEK